MKKLLCLFLCLIMIFTFSTGFSPLNNVSQETTLQYTITEPYNYPMERNSDEWNKLTTTEERRAAFSVPDDIICAMTTEALAKTVLTNPYFIDVLAFDSTDIGIECVSTYVDGLEELLKRDDLNEVVAKLGVQSISEEANINQVETYALRIKIINNIMASLETESVVSPRYSIQTIQTPNGTDVTALYGLTYTYHGFTEEEAYEAFHDMLDGYPSAVPIRDVSYQTDSYNCHSYAWHRQTAQNPYWIDDPTAYMTDGSYTSSTVAVNAKVCWKSSNGSPVHSGIIYSTPSGSTPSVVTSKWDCFGLVRHNINDCPYNSSSLSVGVWR